MRFIRLILLLAVIWGVYNKTGFAQSWEALAPMPGSGKAVAISAHPVSPHILWAATRNAIYTSDSSGASWRESLTLESRHRITAIKTVGPRIFALTSNGLYENRAGIWNQIFTASSPDERHVTSLDVISGTKETYYLGTRAGLFESEDSGTTWKRSNNKLARLGVEQIVSDSENNELFFASARSLYRSLPTRRLLDRVFKVHSTEVEADKLTIEDENHHENEAALLIHDTEIVTTPIPQIVIATAEGLFTSEDEGNYWQSFPTYGLQTGSVQKLVFNSNSGSLFSATTNGLFRFDVTQKKWLRRSEMPAYTIYDIAISQDGEQLLLATDHGMFRARIEIGFLGPEMPQPISISKMPLLESLFASEPTITEIHKQAIQYANIDNAKTRRWHVASRLRALIPSFSISRDYSTSNNIDLDRQSTSKPDLYIEGPPNRSEGLDASIRWDLADFIWSSAQTSIDSREKLMIDLREDLLNEVTRLYFERRRGQIEFAMRSPDDPLERMNAVLRIDELTAHIDALTGGFMGKSLKTIYRTHPEFYDIWKAHSSSEFLVPGSE